MRFVVFAIIGAAVGYAIGDALGTGIIFAKLHYGIAGKYVFAGFGAIIGALAARNLKH